MVRFSDENEDGVWRGLEDGKLIWEMVWKTENVVPIPSTFPISVLSVFLNENWLSPSGWKMHSALNGSVKTTVMVSALGEPFWMPLHDSFCILASFFNSHTNTIAHMNWAGKEQRRRWRWRRACQTYPNHTPFVPIDTKQSRGEESTLERRKASNINGMVNLRIINWLHQFETQ